MKELQITVTSGYNLINGGKFNRVRVECPDCGSGGASSYPCWCSKCQRQTLMLPVDGSTMKNWVEVFTPS